MNTFSVFLLVSSLAVSLSAASSSGSLAGRLDLVDEPNVNELNIILTFSGVSDSDVSQVTGHLDVEVASGDGGAPAGLTIAGGRLFFSDTSYEFHSNFVTWGTAEAAGLTGTLLTPEPPAPVEANGDFDAAYHELTIDGGTVGGQSLFGDSFTADFAEEPYSGPGAGTAQLAVSPEGDEWLVTIDFPVLIHDIIDADGFEVTVEIVGTIRASGLLESSAIGGFAAWVAALEPPLPVDATGPLDRNGPFSLPNLLFYATGLHPLSGDSPLPSLEIQGSPDPVWVVTHLRRRNAPDVELRLTGAPLLTDTGSWQPLQVTGETVTELDAETDQVESIIDSPPDAPAWFIRLEATSLP